MLFFKVLSMAIVTLAMLPQQDSDAALKHFRDVIKPLLESRCIACHHADDAKGGLRLDTRDKMLKGGDNGPAINLKQPEKSLILQAVMHSKKSLQMPPKEKLSQQEIADLRRWIKEGAHWPATEIAKKPIAKVKGPRLGDAWTDPNNPVVKLWGTERSDLWSMKPIKLLPPPEVKKADWAKNPIDRFILARLESKGLAPSPQADKRTLIRRLTFDITGLPPTPGEVDAFLADTSADAYEKLVDSLLASPAYGEHWARQWLDVVRYSDSNGFDWDEFRPHAWRYRDYVIRALNADKPYDRFVQEQIAGDELVDGPPKSAAEQDALIATGYLRLGPQDNSAPLFNEQSRARAELLADLTETTGSAFLGLTLSCCRCHNHKTDPLLQADHYRFRAFFEPVKYADNVPLDLAAEQAEIQKHNQEIDRKIASLTSEKSALTTAIAERLKLLQIGVQPPWPAAMLAFFASGHSKTSKTRLKTLQAVLEPSEKLVMSALPPEQKQRVDAITATLAELKTQKRPYLRGLLMTDAREKIPATHILYQGDHKAPREPVDPGYLSILDPNAADIQVPANPKTSGRRLTLARWITSANNPFAARVMVNRVWLGYFGKGLVETPNDFGISGARPSQPELLDWLAHHWVHQAHWSLKSLHRLIVTSATYRQASQPGDTLRQGQTIDPQNSLLWRQNPKRLTAEQLRDALLASSLMLKSKQGGAPVWPPLPVEVLQANPAFLDDNAEKTKGWYESPAPEQPVRSIYLVQKRTVRVPFMETFDQPENAVSCAARARSNVVPQALSLLNGSTTIDASRTLAQQTIKSVGFDANKQIDFIYRCVFQRQPSASERDLSQTFLQKMTLTELCRVLLNTNEFLYVN